MYLLENIKFFRNKFNLTVDNLKIEKGKSYAIVGPNGSGKSTLLELLALLQKPDSGTIIFQERRVRYNNSGQILNMRQQISTLLQNPYLFKTSVISNIQAGLKIRGISEKEISERCSKIMDELKISHLADRHVRTLSGGESQRVALARSLVLDADVYLLDEPTTSIDRENIEITEKVITNLHKKRGAALIFTTHSRDQAMRLAETQIAVIQGRIKSLPYENVFTGSCSRKKNSLKIRGVEIRTGETIKGSAVIAIDPSDIIVSLNPLDSSALNSFSGTVNKIETFNKDSVQIFVDTGITFCSLITKTSLHKLGITIGTKVWITFKATAVKIISKTERE